MKLSQKFLLYVILPVLVMGILMMFGYRQAFQWQLNHFVRGRPEIRMFYDLHPYLLKSQLKRLEKAKQNMSIMVTLSFILSFGISIATALVLSEIFQKKVSKVVDEISHATEKMAYAEEIKIESKTFSVEFEKLVESIEKLSHKLKEQSLARQSMTSSVYHELMTPLSVMKMQLEALRDGMITYDQNLTKKMIKSVDHISQVLKDVKNIEGGEIKYSEEEFNAALECKELCNTFASVFESRNVNLKCFIEDVYIKVDKRRFKQVIFNLMSNAVKYTPSSGKVEVKIDATGVEFFNTSKSVPTQKFKYGSGLNFVKRFCDFYQWKFTITSSPEGVRSIILFCKKERT